MGLKAGRKVHSQPVPWSGVADVCVRGSRLLGCSFRGCRVSTWAVEMRMVSHNTSHCLGPSGTCLQGVVSQTTGAGSNKFYQCLYDVYCSFWEHVFTYSFVNVSGSICCRCVEGKAICFPCLDTRQNPGIADCHRCGQQPSTTAVQAR